MASHGAGQRGRRPWLGFAGPPGSWHPMAHTGGSREGMRSLGWEKPGGTTQLLGGRGERKLPRGRLGNLLPRNRATWISCPLRPPTQKECCSHRGKMCSQTGPGLQSCLRARQVLNRSPRQKEAPSQQFPAPPPPEGSHEVNDRVWAPSPMSLPDPPPT